MLVLHQKQGKEINKTSEMSTKRRITYRFSYAMRPNDTNKMTPPPLPLPPPHTHTFPAICVIPRISTKSKVFLSLFEIYLLSVT